VSIPLSEKGIFHDLIFFVNFALVIEMTASVSSGFKKNTVSSINKKQGAINVITPPQ